MGGEVGRVLGGGVRAGSLVLIGGGPGLGKSTMLIQLAALIAASPPWNAAPGSPLAEASERVLYVSGEESADQLADRAERLQVLPLPPPALSPLCLLGLPSCALA